jgi:hypothetical protein
MPRAEILTHQAKHTLLQLHAELCGKVDANKKEAERLAESIRHVEAVLKLLDPDFSLRPVAVHRRKVNPWFKRGTQFRYALDVLRTAGKPLTTAEIVTRMIQAKGVKEPSQEDIRVIFGSVGKSLEHQIGETVMRYEGRPVRWTVNGQ